MEKQRESPSLKDEAVAEKAQGGRHRTGQTQALACQDCLSWLKGSLAAVSTEVFGEHRRACALSSSGLAPLKRRARLGSACCRGPVLAPLHGTEALGA